MPPKSGRKRGRDSTGSTGTPSPESQNQPSSALPGSAPPAASFSRTMRSNSNSSQQEDDAGGSGSSGGGGDPRATKRSRHGGPAGREADSSGDVGMGEVTNVVTKTPTAAAAAASAGAKKGGGRRKSTSVVVANGNSADAAAPQPASKRVRNSTPSAAPTATAPIANGGGRPAAVAGAGRRPPVPPPAAAAAAASASASRTPAGARAGAGGRGSAGQGSGVAFRSSAANGAVGAPAAAATATATAPSFGASVIGNNERAAAALAAEQVKAQQARPRPQASPSAASSPVPAARLRCVTGPESSNGDGDGDDGGGSGGSGGGGDLLAGGEEGWGGLVEMRWRAVVSKGRGAWAVVCDKCLPEGGVHVRDMLPVVQRLTLRCLLLLVFLLGARVVWVATLWVAGGLGARGGSSGGSVSGGSGMSRRQAALSLVRQSEGFRSLEGVLGERRRYLEEMEMLDAREQEKLTSLRNFVHNLDVQMELLRKQAADAAGTRGAPENPEVSKEVALSQLEDVKAMQQNLKSLMEATSNAVEEGQTWTLSASEELEALAARSLATDTLSAETKAEVDAEVEEEWATVFSRPVEEAFLALEDVSFAKDELDGLAATKLSVERSADFVREVEEAKQSAAAAVAEDGNRRLQHRVKAIAEQQVALKWGEAGNTEENDNGGSHSDCDSGAVLRTVYEAEELVAREVEIFTSGGTGMPDYASLTPGASVVHGRLMLPLTAAAAAAAAGALELDDEAERGLEVQLTSPTLASTQLPWAGYMLHMLRVPGRVFAENADAALSASNSLGSCFAFHGGEGRLTVKLAPPPPSSRAAAAASPSIPFSTGSASAGGSGGVSAAGTAPESSRTRGFIKVTHVSIEHARTAAAPTALKSAPRGFRVLGWDADPSGPETTPYLGGEGEGEDGWAGVLRPFVLLEGAEYQAGGGAFSVQTFAVSEERRERAPPVGWVTLEVQSNHGGKWTCLYGFRVHGDPVV